MTNKKTTKLIMAALFAALTGVCSWIAIPLPFTQVPIVLATMVTTLAGGLLGPKYGTFSMIVYVLLGAIGAPVFHNFSGGLGVIVGPTGGYIVGYITSAFICGILLNIICSKKLTRWGIAISGVAGLASCYAIGTAWFMISSGTGLIASLIMCVIPFLIGDVLKTIAAVLLIKKLRPIIYLP